MVRYVWYTESMVTRMGVRMGGDIILLTVDNFGIAG